MRPVIRFLIFLMIMSTFTGCNSNQYQIVTAADGALYRFNKKTGELSMIMDEKKSALPSVIEKHQKAKAEKSDSVLEKPVDWKESRYPGKDLRVRLETIWRENKLCYKFLAYPYKSLEKTIEKKKQDYIYSIMKPGFNVELVDENGFIVKEIKINLLNMTKVTASDGKEEELVLNSQVDCTKQSYKSIGGYTVKWLVDPELIDDEKESFLKSDPIKIEKK